MPRRPAVILPGIPSFLILPVLQKEIERADRELERIVVKNVKGSRYDISVRIKAIPHPLQALLRAGKPSGGKEATPP